MPSADDGQQPSTSGSQSQGPVMKKAKKGGLAMGGTLEVVEVLREHFETVRREMRAAGSVIDLFIPHASTFQ